MHGSTIGRLSGLLAILMIAGAGCERKPRVAERAARPVAADSALDPRIIRALPPGVTAEMARAGHRLFVAQCAACHGPSGTGTQLGPALNSGEWLHTRGEPAAIAHVIEQGLPPEKPYSIPMPGRAGAFDAEQLRSLAGYVYALRGTAP